MSNKNVISESSVLSSRDTTTVGSAIPNHRHCQSTVCSIYGHQDDGTTMGIINGAEFTNLPEDWRTKFSGNTTDNGRNNITYDFKSMLSLLDGIIGELNQKSVDLSDLKLQFTRGG